MTPVIELAALENAAAKLTASAKAFDAAYAAKGATLSAAQRSQVE